jgi:ribosomal-protein-alanine N-acetyltransferase
MRRRHLRGVMAIERQVYARPWSPNLFVAEMTEPNNRCYLVARVDKAVVGTANICRDEAHVTNTPSSSASPRHRHEAAARPRPRRSRWGHAVSEVRVTTGAQRLSGDSDSGRSGIRRNYYQEPHEDASDHVDRRHPHGPYAPTGGDRLVDAGSGAPRITLGIERRGRDRRRGGGGRG